MLTFANFSFGNSKPMFSAIIKAPLLSFGIHDGRYL